MTYCSTVSQPSAIKITKPMWHTCVRCLSLCMMALGSIADLAADTSVRGLTDPDFYVGLEKFYADESEQPSFIVEYDPWEPVNRHIHKFNVQFDERVFLPVVNGYRRVIPSPVRTGVRNFFSNLAEIPVFINCVLQFKAKKTATTAIRFVVNSTIGVVGVFDVATHLGLASVSEDLGQTLGFYGIGAGPYLVLPILGPSNLRDAVGLAGDFMITRKANVLGVAQNEWESTPLFVLDAVQTREKNPFRYGDLNSPFEYQLLRYLYTQSRELKVAD